MSEVDPYAEVRREFAAGLGARVAALRNALGALKTGFDPDAAARLHLLAHTAAGTAISFEAERMARLAQELEEMTAGWRAQGTCTPEQWRAAAALVDQVEDATREYVDALTSRPVESAVARLAVVGQLSQLISVTYDLPEIFRSAILLVRRVLDFRRASVALVDPEGTHYVLHTLYDALRGGFITRDLKFSLEEGLTGQVIRSGQALKVEDLEGRDGILAQPGQRVSAMLVPLKVNDVVIGTLNFGHERPGHYSETDLELAGVLAHQIQISLQFSTLLSTIARQGEALARERNQLEALVGASDTAILLVGLDQTVAYANSRMTRLLGIPQETIVGADVNRLHDFLAASLDDPAAMQPQLEAMRQGLPLTDRIELALPARATYQRVVAPVRDSAGVSIGSLLQYRDVTREAELERLKSEFVSVVSHELRTPMTSIKTSLALVLAGAVGPIEPSARELLQIAARNSDRLIGLVNDLLDLSRIQSGRMPLRPEPVSMHEVVLSSVEMVGAFANERGVGLDIPSDLDGTKVMGVRDRLIQVMVNLLSNAVKFSPRGSRVGILWRDDGTVATIEVTDQGQGIPAEKLETVFEPFTQLASSITRDQGGAGLGLTISRDIVQALRGRIWVESEPGRGSRFYVELPLAAREPVHPSESPSSTRRDAHILVIHSDPDWRCLCSTTFRTEGWRVSEVTSGAEGLAFLRDTRVDLIVVGLELSDLHGLSVLEQVRQAPLNCDIPALVVGEGEVAHVTDYGAEALGSGAAGELVDHARRQLSAPLRPVILHVEDDPAVRDSIRKALRRSGYACISAAEARQALALLSIRRPGLIITDIRMPDMDGLSFLQGLRHDPALADIPFIVLSAHVGPGVLEEVNALSARLLRKPADLSELLAEIRALI